MSIVDFVYEHLQVAVLGSKRKDGKGGDGMQEKTQDGRLPASKEIQEFEGVTHCSPSKSKTCTSDLGERQSGE